MKEENTKIKILVVDDEPGMREMLSFSLGMQGFDITTAACGEEAVEKAATNKFDLMITDMKMPGMDGIQTLVAIKKIDPDMETIVATGFGNIETAVLALKEGAFDYVFKPIGVDELDIIIQRALQRRNLQMENRKLKKEINQLLAQSGQPPKY